MRREKGERKRDKESCQGGGRVPTSPAWKQMNTEIYLVKSLNKKYTCGSSATAGEAEKGNERTTWNCLFGKLRNCSSEVFMDKILRHF